MPTNQTPQFNGIDIARLFSGIHAFTYTPAGADAIDFIAFREQLNRLLDAGVHGLVPSGSVSEFAYLTEEHRRSLLETTKEVADDRVPVVANATAHTTEEVIRYAKHAAEVGANAQLLNVHSYFPLFEEEVFQHFAAAAEAAPDMPLIIYNSPSVTGFTYTISFLERLSSEIPQIVAVKESSRDLNLAERIVDRLGDKLSVLCGHEALALPLFSVGATGWMSAIASLIPEGCVALYDAVSAGDLARAQVLHKAIEPLGNLLQAHHVPAAIKTILDRENIPAAEPIRPLLPLEGESAQAAIDTYERTTAELAK